MATIEARALVIKDLVLKEAATGKINKEMEEACIKMEINMQHHKNNVHKLEQMISSAKVVAEIAKQQQELVIPPPPSELEEEVNNGRKCILCKTNEVSILLLPCTHQVMCVTCYDVFRFEPKHHCPICLTPVEQNIHVSRGSSY